MNASYETLTELKVEVEGLSFIGRYRVMHGTVIVYYESEIKFASHGMTEPVRVAKWILADLVRRVEFRKKRTSGTG